MQKAFQRNLPSTLVHAGARKSVWEIWRMPVEHSDLICQPVLKCGLLAVLVFRDQVYSEALEHFRARWEKHVQGIINVEDTVVQPPFHKKDCTRYSENMWNNGEIRWTHIIKDPEFQHLTIESLKLLNSKLAERGCKHHTWQVVSTHLKVTWYI